MHTLTNSFETFKCFAFYSKPLVCSLSKIGFSKLCFFLLKNSITRLTTLRVTSAETTESTRFSVPKSQNTYYERRLPGIYLISASFRKRVVDPMAKIRSRTDNFRKFSLLSALTYLNLMMNIFVNGPSRTPAIPLPTHHMHHLSNFENLQDPAHTTECGV